MSVFTLNHFKDLFFVLCTGLLLFILIRQFHGQILNRGKQYRNLFEGNPNPFWFYDPQTFRFISVNDAAVAGYGYSRNEFLSMTVFDLRPKKDIKRLKVFCHQMSYESQNTGILEHIKRDGSHIYVSVSSHRTWLNGRELVMVMAIDTTQAILQERELKALNSRLIQQKKKLDKDYFRLEDTLNNISDSFFTLNRAWNFTKANAKFYTSTNIKDSVEGKSLIDVFPDVLETAFYSEAKKAMDIRQMVKFEEFYPLFDKWFCLSAYPTEEGIAVYFTDITSDKEKDIQLKLALERYELASQATGDVIYDLDLLSDVLSFNKQISSLIDVPEDIIDKNLNWWRAFVHPDDLPKLIASQQQIIDMNGKRWEAEYRILTGREEYKYVYDQGYLLFDEHKKPVRIIGAIKDISIIKHTEEQIKRMGEILNKINLPVILYSPKGIVKWINPAFMYKTGFNKGEIIGLEFSELLKRCHINKESADQLGRAIISGEEFSTEFINYCNSEIGYWESFTLSPVYDEQGGLESFISVESDITERKERESQIARQNEKLSAVSWLNSHEVRKPVSTILGLVQLIKNADPLTDQAELIDMLNQSALELDHIIRQINKEASGR